jgi:hypothetical protein
MYAYQREHHAVCLSVVVYELFVRKSSGTDCHYKIPEQLITTARHTAELARRERKWLY